MWPFTKKLSGQIEELKRENKRLSKDIDDFFDLLTEDALDYSDLSLKNARIKLLSIFYLIKIKKESIALSNFMNKSLDNLHAEMHLQNQKMQDQIIRYKSDIEELRKKKLQLIDEVIDLRQEKMYQEFGLYTPVYDLMTSSLYKDRINSCREEQKQMIKNKLAATCSSEWRINNSRREGVKMTNRNIKQILRCFNDECDYLISKVKYYNVDSIKKKIVKSFEELNKLNEPSNITLSSEYLQLKLDELCLCFEYADKKQKEKEELRERKRREREESELLKEIEEERKKLNKEKKHYQTNLMNVWDQLHKEQDPEKIKYLKEKEIELQLTIEDIEHALSDIDYREANQKAGYVYVISNIGSFGEDIYKIGMTRRLDPQDRIDELSTAAGVSQSLCKPSN